jgi:hypothetical protein
MKKIAVFLFVVIAFAQTQLNAQQVFNKPRGNNMDVKGNLDWERMAFNLTVTLNLKNSGIKLPAGRARAETLLEDEFSFLIETFLMDVQADSSSTLRDMINRKDLTTAAFSRNTSLFPPALSSDLSFINGRAAVNLTGIASELVRHSVARIIHPPLVSVPVRNYTGIIIIADENLPVHGTYTTALAVPCLFPKIWDSEMNQLYGRDTVDPQALRREIIRYVGRESIMRDTPSAMNADLIQRVGDNPLRIMARSLFGVVPTDPIIDREDALLILSSENNRKLLSEGRIVIVLDKKQLTKNLP